MKLFDSHCHFETCDETEIAAILQRARAAGVEKLLAVGGSASLNFAAETAVRMAAAGVAGTLPEVVIATGYDRDQATGKHLPDFTGFQNSVPPVARGEIGLDYHYSPETRDAQLKLFASELAAARAADLPVVIHTREAAWDTIRLLKEIPSRGIIHCFTGEPDEARAYLDLGYYISVSGIVTFASAEKMRTTALAIPDDRLLIETDSPYLAPVPKRGGHNEPAFLRYTCEYLASLRGMTADALADLTFANTEKALT